MRNNAWFMVPHYSFAGPILQSNVFVPSTHFSQGYACSSNITDLEESRASGLRPLEDKAIL